MASDTLGVVVATASASDHKFSKQNQPFVNLLKGLGVEGDCHAGKTVQHRSRLHIRPAPANLRQVHLMPCEILSKFSLEPAELGENITTSGINLLSLSRGTKLHFMDAEMSMETATEHAVVVVQGLRNPCPQIEKHEKGLQEKFIVRDVDRKIVKRLAGVMGTVDIGGVIRPGMKIVIEEPMEHEPLACV